MGYALIIRKTFTSEVVEGQVGSRNLHLKRESIQQFSIKIIDLTEKLALTLLPIDIIGSNSRK